MRIALIPAAAGALLFSAPAFAQDSNLVLVNESGKTIASIQISATGANEWKDNMVDTDPNAERVRETPSGGKMTVFFNAGDQCRFDLKATFKDGGTAVWTNLNTCDNWRVRVRMKGETTEYAYN